MVTLRFVTTFALVAFATGAVAQQVELLDFYLPTCGPCKAMAPTVARLEAEGVPVRRVDGSREAELAARLGVDRYPTFVAVANGQEVGRRVGMVDYAELRSLVAPAPSAGGLQAVKQTRAAAAPQQETFATVGGDWGAGQPAATSAAAPSVPRGADRLLARSVRLTVDEGGAVSYGTGTIVDARSGEALVVTCAHLFLNERREPIDTTGKLSIELFDAAGGAVRVAQRVEGQLVSHDAEADVALVAIRPRGVVQTAGVAASPADLRIGDAVRSVGCDLGADPTVREHQVVDLNRYEGPPNTEASGAPIQGRSGGGLFDADGRLVGVCNFADKQADEGIYAGLASIHAQLDRVGLSELYRGGAEPAAPTADAFAAAAPREAPAAKADLRPIERTPIVRGQNAGFASPPDATPELTPTEEATLSEIAGRAERASVTVVIHPEGGGSEVLTLDTASPEFVAALRRLAAPR